MRTLTFVAMTLALTLTTAAAVRAEEKGFIGVKIEKADGGIELKEVIADSPAEKAGLKMGDVIKKMNGEDVTNIDVMDFVKKIVDAKPGDEIKLTVARDGKDVEIKVKVGKKDAE